MLDDDGFWERVSQHVKATLPAMKMLRRFDTGAPTLGKLYSSWFELGMHFKNLPEGDPLKQAAIKAHEERWAYGHSAISAAAYVLDPEFHGHSQESNSEVVEGFLDFVEKVGILMATRAQYADNPEHLKKLWDQRQQMINGNPEKQLAWDHFPSYASKETPFVKDFCKEVNSQMSIYRGKKGVFSRSWIF